MTRSAKRMTTMYMVIFALLVNAIMPAVASVSSNSGKQGVLLCTSQGYKWVKVGADSASGESSTQHCKLCLFPASDDNVDELIVGPDFSLILGNTEIQVIETLYPFFKARFAYLVAQGRAPPFTFFSV